MYITIADKIVELLIKNNVIDETDKDNYKYSFALLLSTSVSIITIFLVSLLLNKTILSLLFLFGFIWTRYFSGGYHANSYFSCFLVTQFNHLLFIAIIIFSPIKYIYIIEIIMFVFSLITILFFAPIEHKNNPLSENEIKRFKRKGKISLIIYCFITVIGFLLKANPLYIFSFIIGVFSASFSIVVAKLQDYSNKSSISRR